MTAPTTGAAPAAPATADALTPDEKAAVARLLRQYRGYKTALAAERALASHLARAKLAGTVDAALTGQVAAARARQQRISDRMTFATPSIWIAYKNRAYRREAQPILTMHDLRQHCRPVGYLCTKRFTFLNQRLTDAGRPTLADQSAYPDELTLPRLLARPELVELAHDPDLLRDWAAHEFHVVDGRVAKWESYSYGLVG